MKKYIFTESQIQRVIDQTINDELMSEQRDKLPNLEKSKRKTGKKLD